MRIKSVKKSRIQLCMGIVLVIILGCSGPRSVLSPPTILEEVLLDSIQIVATRITPENKYALPEYRSSEKRTIDIVHTDLDLHFDWQKQVVHGTAKITLQPVFHPVQVVQFDAQDFEIHNVEDPKTNRSLSFQYQIDHLSIQLEKTITRFDLPVTIQIDYTAFPAKTTEKNNGVISSDQGLFFIDPLQIDEQVPSQIWTQGETENNSRWFPTIDHPNEKMTHQISLTVDRDLKTLSNGILKSSEVHSDGTKTDTWRMDQPHAPYLTMIAVGDYAVIEDVWNHIPVSYYVEHPYAESARIIFNHTTEMMTFFSELLDYPYPWPKFDQIAVRDFVSGAMENTTAVVYGDFVQDHADHFLLENENDYIIAHELIHHWFGNLVTCESWANLALNEGFANYGEYLWFEHKYGKDEADYSRYNELKGYFNAAAYEMHPLIHFGYDDKDHMFDAHSYNKGGLVLHMLRKYVGDDAFFASIQHYIKKHAFETAEVHDLRIAFEEITGEDLNWFFNQWYMSPGHPVIEVQKEYLADKKSIHIQLIQKQDPSEVPPIFQFPLSIDLFFENDSVYREIIWVDQRNEQVEIPVHKAPELVLVNADDVLIAHIDQDDHFDEQFVQLKRAKALRHRLEALYDIIRDESMNDSCYLIAFQDPHWSVRYAAVDIFQGPRKSKPVETLLTLAQVDPDPRVRLEALKKMAELRHPKASKIAEKWILESSKSDIVFTCLEVLFGSDPEKAKIILEKLDDEENEALQVGKSMIYSANGGKEYAPFFLENLDAFDQYLEPFLEHYLIYLGKQEIEVMEPGLQSLVAYVGSQKPPYLRYQAVKKLTDFLIVLKEDRLTSKINREARSSLGVQILTALLKQIDLESDSRWKAFMEGLVEDVDDQ